MARSNQPNSEYLGYQTWTPNQIVANNLNRLRQRRGLTQVDAAAKLSRASGRTWTEAMVAHAERSVTGNRIREFTADDLVTMARAFDVPAIYFLTPPPLLNVAQPDQANGLPTHVILDAVLGRLDNLNEWENILDDWDRQFDEDDPLPFPRGEERRVQVRALAREIALIRAQHVIRRHLKGDLLQVLEVLRGLSGLIVAVNNHETMAEIDEDDYIRRLNENRNLDAKSSRLSAAHRAADPNWGIHTDQDPGR